MAEKKHKKPRHTHLVLPGEVKKEAPAATDRLGRAVPGQGQPGAAAQPPQAAGQPGEATPPPQTEKEQAQPPQTAEPEQPRPQGKLVALPQKRKKRLSPVKRKRRMRRVRILVFLAVVALAVVVYSTGVYLTVFSLAGDLVDGIRISLRPGEGFPAAFTVSGFVKAEGMGKNALAVLGERDFYMVSDTGLNLRSEQHGYATPGFSAGNTRAVVYYRGGKEFVVESRSQTLARRATEQEIQFAEISGSGWLAVVTASRHRAYLHVYGPDYDISDPLLSLTLLEDKPVLAAFASDNRNLLLGCYSASGGALASTIHLLNTGSSEIQATVRVENAQLLRAEYLGHNRFIAIYDQFAALYDVNGAELARYDYAGRNLLTCDVGEGGVALVFGAGSQETVYATLLDRELTPMMEVSEAAGASSPKALVADNGLYLLVGQEVTAYTPQGVLAGRMTLQGRAHALVQGGGQPLAVTAGSIEPLAGLLAPQSTSEAPETSVAPSSAGSGAA